MNVLTEEKTVSADRGIIVPETFRKGKEFEDFIRKQLFPRSRYDILAKTPDYTPDDFIMSAQDPDFKLQSKRSGRVFYVEAKYCSALYQGEFHFKPHQLARYRALNKEVPVYIAIGIGNRPDAPGEVFLVPLRHMPFTKLYRSYLEKHRVPLEPADECRRAVEAVLEPPVRCARVCQLFPPRRPTSQIA